MLIVADPVIVRPGVAVRIAEGLPEREYVPVLDAVPVEDEVLDELTVAELLPVDVLCRVGAESRLLDGVMEPDAVVRAVTDADFVADMDPDSEERADALRVAVIVRETVPDAVAERDDDIVRELVDVVVTERVNSGVSVAREV